MLIAMVVAGIVILASTQMLTSVAQSQGHEEITVPVQESVRGAMEVISMDLRESMTPRVLNFYSGNAYYAAPPVALSAYYSTNTNLTVIGGDAAATFKVAKPATYPTVAGYPSQAFINTSTSCTGVFTTGDYFYLLYLSPTATDATNMSAVWGQAAAGCSGSQLVTASAMPAITNWTLDARVLKARLTRYYMGTLNGQNVLFRQQLGGSTAGAAQVVAFDITGVSFEYGKVDKNTGILSFTTTAPIDAEPLAVRVTLTGQSNQKRAGTASTTPYTLNQVVYMRQTSLGKGF